MNALREQLILAHLERLTVLVNIALNDCVIDDDGLVAAFDEELELAPDRGFKIGDEVFWRDPEDDLCSAYYTIKEFLTNEIVFLVNENSKTEAFLHEIEGV
jgi:hypothetical protein